MVCQDGGKFELFKTQKIKVMIGIKRFFCRGSCNKVYFVKGLNPGVISKEG